jgi:hypothetical protein
VLAVVVGAGVIAGDHGQAAVGRQSPPPVAAPGGGTSGLLPMPQLMGLKAINYNRSDAGWTYLWQRWDAGQMDQDFARIAGFSANAVRIAIQPSAFGWPRPAPGMEAKLARTLAMASAHGLRVELELFDWWGSYSDFASSDRWTKAVVGPLHNDPRLAFIELQNEIKPENAQAMAWAGHELPVVKLYAGDVPVTISVSNNGQFTAVQELAALKVALAGSPPDFYDLHVYGPPGAAYSAMAAAKALVAPAALYIGEVGASSHVGASGSSVALAEAQQDQDLRTVEWAARANGLPPPAVWTYEDLERSGVPAAAGLDDAGYQFGLFRVDGTPKPSVASVASVFRGAPIDTGFNAGFEAGDGGAPALWQQFRPSQGRLAWDPSVAHSGRASVRLSQTTGDATGAPSFNTTPVVSPLRAGEQFHVGVWAKGAMTTGVNVVSVSWFGAGYAYLGRNDSSPLPSGNTGWTQLGGVAVVPAGALYGQIFVKSFNNRGTVWYDDVTFSPVAGAGE